MATTTPNYGWAVPTSTDLVKDGATAIETLGDAIDASMNTALGTKKAGMVLLNTTSFSAVSSVSLPDNTFTTTYHKYLIEPRLQSSAGVGINMRLRASGTDTSGTVYRRQFIAGNNTSVTGARTTGSTSWINIIYVADSTEFSSSLLFLHNPRQATYTSALANYVIAQSGDVETSFQGYGINATTAFDSLTLIPASGTITGSVSVYGYSV
jgi:hypothetical protein